MTGVNLERLRYAWVRAREEGVRWTTLEIGRRAVVLLLSLILLPATLFAHLAGLRRLPVITERVGHLAAEVDCFLKLRAQGRLAARRYFVLAPANRVSNRCLAEYWAGQVPLVKHKALCSLLSTMSRIGLMRHDVSDYVLKLDGPARYGLVNAEWGGRDALLQLTDEHAARGRKVLHELGVPDSAWYVCIHVRESGYSMEDRKVHAYRDADVRSVVPAINAIVDRGGWCIRMGDPSMTPLGAVPGAIDYAHHPLRSPEMDVFLCARCKFFLGNTSGLFIVSSVFGIPSALANMVPFASMGYGVRDLSIPKLLFSQRESRYLSFREVLSSPVANYRMGSMFQDAGIRLVDNTPEDILDLAIEMLDRLDHRTEPYAEFQPLQVAFKQLVRPTHHCYGSPANIGARFLVRHRDLLEGAEGLGSTTW